ncbi:Alkanesulfonates transport system permease protein [Rhodovastum atsumiense]|uniref:ABC transporter permease n=1 Tax=Rhodovastum atsumiense TaxID=504468 RepID=A0A5M6IWE5_9PROT|nr:ABC transporter permease [Rhodovastum atsumiense]KAA5612612.1 ABC transporter permease [Rhodovastum atsumiense]CAH2601289.1 Alkanesulfonates transport system permease protein [Rhodovastum atsumiense]
MILPSRAAVLRRLRPWLVPLLALALWDLGSRAGWFDPRLLPSPEAILARFRAEVANGDLGGDVAASLSRDLAGFAIGASTGVALGLLLGLSHLAERLLGPLFLAYRQVALFAWVPLLSMWFGGNEVGKIAFISLAALAPAVVNTWRGTREIPRTQVELAAVLTFGRLDFIRFIALPAALPAIATGLRTALIYAWLATIGAELFLNIAPGLGGRMNEGRETFQMDLLLTCLIVLGVLGIVFARAATAAEAALLRRRMA